MEDPDPDPYLTALNILAEQFFLGFSSESIIALVVMFFLVIASGLVSGSETAFFSLTPSDIETLRTSPHSKENLILELRNRPKTLLATILISNNFINVAIVILAAYITALIFNLDAHPVLAFILQVVVITSIILLFGEIIPKILANKEPLTVANLMVRPLNFLVWFFRPLSLPLVRSTSMIDKRLGKKGHNISASDLSDAIEITVDESVPEDQKMILKGIASFVEREASEIMQSRVNVTAVDGSLPFREMMKIVMDSGFSRIPVYQDTLDKIAGILYIKDLLPYLELEEKRDWVKLVRPAFFVPENKRINDLLQEFRTKKIHLAIVVDEYGGTSGIITLEDIIEEIVGEISDEFDKEDYQFRHKRISAKSYLFEAKTPLNDMCRIIGIDDGIFDPVRGESDSLGGLILELEGKIPEKGAEISYRNYKFTVTDVTSRRIKEVKITLTNEIVKDEE